MTMVGRFKDYIGSIIRPVVEAIKPKWIVAEHNDAELALAFTAALTDRIEKELGAFGMKFVTDAVNAAEATYLPGSLKTSFAVAYAEHAFKDNSITSVSGVTLTAAIQCAVIELKAAKLLNT